ETVSCLLRVGEARYEPWVLQVQRLVHYDPSSMAENYGLVAAQIWQASCILRPRCCRCRVTLLLVKPGMPSSRLSNLETFEPSSSKPRFGRSSDISQHLLHSDEDSS